MNFMTLSLIHNVGDNFRLHFIVLLSYGVYITIKYCNTFCYMFIICTLLRSFLRATYLKLRVLFASATPDVLKYRTNTLNNTHRTL